jgi:hypothetical protein
VARLLKKALALRALRGYRGLRLAASSAHAGFGTVAYCRNSFLPGAAFQIIGGEFAGKKGLNEQHQEKENRCCAAKNSTHQSGSYLKLGDYRERNIYD